MGNEGLSLFGIVCLIAMCCCVIFEIYPELTMKDEFTNIDMKCVALSDENQALLILNHTINTPDLLNCSQLAWIIENQAYPSGYLEYHKRYREPNCGNDNITIVSTTSIPNIKESYDDYYFRKCLTKQTQRGAE